MWQPYEMIDGDDQVARLEVSHISIMFVAKQIFRVSGNLIVKNENKICVLKVSARILPDDHAASSGGSGGGGRAVQFHLELTIDKRGRWWRKSAVLEF